jgi:tricorn protease interacting factor F2/3
MSSSVPVQYRVHIEPDVKTFTFSGQVEVVFACPEPVRDILLNALDIAVWSCRLTSGGKTVSCPFEMDPGKESLRVVLPVEASGEVRLAIDYMGRINDKMAGFYRSRYLAKDGERWIAITQFEESDARRAFPCVDHPAAKATFDIELSADAGLTAISNTPVAEERTLENGRRLFVFETTPRMSTYLVFFGVGDFRFIEDPKSVTVRVAAVTSVKEAGKYALDFGRKALDYCDAYYGIPYPLSKLDLIAVPDFAFGAMENWGAITFRENLLLHHPGITSRAAESRICEVIAHEIAHQWFGNLVTPSDWRYLWLNESFATYFGYGAVHHYYPEWDVWEQFVHALTSVALERDALHETFPIEIPGGEHVVINPGTAPIIYNKGASVLRQVKGFIGEEAFQAGLRGYLKDHAYGCAASRDLWEAFESASDRPITRLMESWVAQPGFPVVSVSGDGENISLVQERFTYLPGTFHQTWIVPVNVAFYMKDGEVRRESLLLEGETGRIPMVPGAVAYKINDGHTGFYRVRYEDRGNLERLAAGVRAKTISPMDRWGLQDDIYAGVKRRDSGVADYLHFITNYEDEDAFLPLVSIAGHLLHAYLVLDGEKRLAAADAGAALCERILKIVGLEPRRDERQNDAVLRERALPLAALFGNREAEDFCLVKFSDWLDGRPVHPDLMKGIMEVGAMRGDRRSLQGLIRRLESSASEHERMNILIAMGRFSDTALIQAVQEYILTKVPDRNKFVPIMAMSENPYALRMLWEWFVSRIETFEAFHPIHFERVITGIVPIGGLGREEEARSFLDKYARDKGRARDVIKLSLERLEVHRRMREAARDDVD